MPETSSSRSPARDRIFVFGMGAVCGGMVVAGLISYGVLKGPVPSGATDDAPAASPCPDAPASSPEGQRGGASVAPAPVDPPPLPERPLPPLRPLGSGDFARARRLDDGTWSLEGTRVKVYSWSYGKPGILAFGPIGSGGLVEARLRSAETHAGAYQGLAFCPEGVKSDCESARLDGAGRPVEPAAEALAVLYSEGRFALRRRLGVVGFGDEPLAMSGPVALEAGAGYAMRMRVIDGRHVRVEIDGAPVLEWTGATPRRGRFAAVAANGNYEFGDLRFGVNE